MPIGEGRLFQADAEKDPGIVEEDVEAAETVGDGGNGRTPIPLARHVETSEHRLTAGTLDCPHGIAPALVEHIADRDVGAGFGHQPRSFGADAPRRSGNQRDLSLEPVHCRSPNFYTQPTPRRTSP